MRKLFLRLLVIIVVIFFVIYFGNSIFILLEKNTPSKSIGTTSNGKLVYGKRLLTKGSNFVTYSYIGALLGRNSVHNKVRDVIIETYEILAEKYPEKKFVYGETGWSSGGNFAPHHTHQNGLSVDFMVSILDKNNRSISLPTSLFNRFGYGIEFDLEGKTKDYTIDFETMAAHIYYLNETAEHHGIGIWRVIFDPKLQPYLLNTEFGEKIKETVQFSKTRSWVRHDEHFHVDFDLRN